MILDTTCMETVEYLRGIMIKTAEERGSLTHPDVIEISQRLDLVINDIQRKQRNKRYINNVREIANEVPLMAVWP